MTAEQFIEILEADGVALAAAAERAGLGAPVPTCPGWTVGDLLVHLGGVHRWAAAHVAEQSRERFPEDYTAPADGLLDWYRDRHSDLVTTLRAADPAVQCWTFLPAPSPLEFWCRRQAHETAIHRADAESALGATPAWTPWFAADGIDELLTGFLARRAEGLVADPPSSMAVHATDIDRAWTIRMAADGLHVTTTGQADVPSLTGTASDLYLYVWNRIGAERLTADGDQEVWTVWREKAIVT